MSTRRSSACTWPACCTTSARSGSPTRSSRSPAPLETHEWAEMRKHPELGARILQGAHLDDIAGWVLAHHERPDGQGYPIGLAGRADPDPGAHPRRRGRVRGDDERPRLPAGDARGGGAGRARALRRHAVRRGRSSRTVREAARAGGPLRRARSALESRGRCDERAPGHARKVVPRTRRLPRRGHGRRPARDGGDGVPHRARGRRPRTAVAAGRAGRRADRLVDPLHHRRRARSGRACGSVARPSSSPDTALALHYAGLVCVAARRMALGRARVPVHDALPALDGRRRRVASAAPDARHHRRHRPSSRACRSSTTTGRASSPATWHCGS